MLTWPYRISPLNVFQGYLLGKELGIMPEFVYHFSSIPLFIFLNFVLISISVLAVTLTRHHIPVDFRYEENTAIVSCSALLGIIFAILIGFTILYQMNAFDRVSKAETTEGKILFDIYRNAASLPDANTTNSVRILVLDYAKNAIQNEWPTLGVGNKVDTKGKTLIENIGQQIQTTSLPANNALVKNASSLIMQDLNALYELRHERVSKVHTTLNGHMWFVILLSTFITLGINYLLGMDYRLHVFCITLISVIMATILYLIVGLDRPYQGDFVVHPDSIATVLEFAESGGTDDGFKSQQVTLGFV